MSKKKTTATFRDTQNLVLFPAEETLKSEQGNFWSGATKATKSNIRKQ